MAGWSALVPDISLTALWVRDPTLRVARSYRHAYALVAWHPEPVGVDIERVDAYDPEFAQSTCTPSEREARGASGPWRASALEAPAGHVAWLCWRVDP